MSWRNTAQDWSTTIKLLHWLLALAVIAMAVMGLVMKYGDFTPVERIRLYTLPRTKKLLIVEDDAGERLGIEELIRHDDVDIESAGDGAAAMEKLRAGKYDCVVLDLRLPDMSGFDLIEHIQAEPRLHDVPLVVFTGRELSAEEDRLLRRAAT